MQYVAGGRAETGFMKKSLSFLLPFILLCIAHCMSQEKINSSEQIPILAWGGIPARESSIARYQEMRASGITHNYTLDFPNVEALEKALDIAKKTGVKIIASCPELKTEPEKTVKKFMNHPSVAGYFLRDEPNRSDFAELGKWAKRIRAVDDKKFCYLNLFPNYASKEQLGTKTYREYVNLFIKEVPIQLLSFDHYPIIEDSSGRHFRNEWYENLEIFSDEAKKAGKPFWAFALTVAAGNYPVPTVSELRLQVYSNLAYGAQGIQYFTYWTPGKDPDWNFHHGPVTSDTKQRTEVYDRMKLVNQEVQNLSGVFSGAKVISVAHTGTTIPQGTKRLMQLPAAIKTLETEGEGAVVSVLEKGKENFLVIVNRDFKHTMKLTIEGDKTLKKVLKDGTVVPADSYIRTMEIDPGDVAIYRWVNTSSTLKK